jgi:hypothetical protein
MPKAVSAAALPARALAPAVEQPPPDRVEGEQGFAKDGGHGTDLAAV